MTQLVDGLLKIGVHRCLHYRCGCEVQSYALSLSIHSEIVPLRLRVHRGPVSLISLDLQNVRATIWSTTYFSAILLGYWSCFGLLHTGESNRNEKTNGFFQPDPNASMAAVIAELAYGNGHTSYEGSRSSSLMIVPTCFKIEAKLLTALATSSKSFASLGDNAAN